MKLAKFIGLTTFQDILEVMMVLQP